MNLMMQGRSQNFSAPRRFLLSAFLAAQFIGLSRTFFMSVLGDGFNQVAAFCAYGSLLLLPFLLEQYRHTSRPGEQIGSTGATWLLLLALSATFSLLHGFFLQYDTREIIQDYAPYVIIGVFAVIGSRQAFWDDLIAILPWMLFAGLAINGLGFVGFGNLIERDIGERIGRESLAYRTQSVLGMWGMALLLVRRQRATFKFLAILTLYFYIGQQVLFQKRLGTIESVFYLSGFFIVFPLFARTRSDNDRLDEVKIFVGLVGMSIVAFVVAVTLSDGLIVAQAQALYQRFVGVGTGQRKEGVGLIATIFLENERMELAGRLLSDFRPFELITGRGMGGYFTIPVSLNDNEVVRQQQYLSMYLDDVGVFGRRGIEIGWLMPFLKGGAVLMLIMGYGIMAAISRLNQIRYDPITLAAWIWLAIETLFLLQGGGFIISAAYRLVLLGACIGRCLSTVPRR
jgi:hypothetical protein